MNFLKGFKTFFDKDFAKGVVTTSVAIIVTGIILYYSNEKKSFGTTVRGLTRKSTEGYGT